jgi:hypothetical protein
LWILLAVLVFNSSHTLLLAASESAVVLFQRDKAELLALLASCNLNETTPVASLQMANGTAYLVAIGIIRVTDRAPASLGAAKTVAHAKALRTISQFMKTEVNTEDSLKEIITVRSNGGVKENVIEKIRTESIQIRSNTIISQAYLLDASLDAAQGTYKIVLALALKP